VGGAGYLGSSIRGYPAQSSSTTYTLGAYAGAGASIFVTNAASVQQLGGPFTTASFNFGVGLVNIGVQLSFGGGIWQLAVTPPFASVGVGIAGSVVTTNTKPTNSSCR
jgi:hypothetical protein